MNKQAVVLLLTAAFMTFAGCVPNEAQTDMTDAPQEIETAQTENDCETELKDEIEKQIALEKYGSAVKLAEDNAAVIEADRGKYDDVMDDILIHFTQIAKGYYTNAATYVVRQEVMGYDMITGFEGYDPATETIDPHVFEEYLTEEEKVALDRVVIKVTDTENMIFRVTIEVCGMTAEYPADDIRL